MNYHGYLQDTEWSETIANKYGVKIGERVVHKFIHTGVKKIEKLIPMCSCIKIVVSNNEYSISFKLKTKQTTRKMVEVKYKDGSRDYLIIKVNNDEN